MYDRPAVVALREFIGTIVTADSPLTLDERQAELRAHVCTLVDDLKAANWPPERVIVAVKTVAADAGLHPSRNILSAMNQLSEPDAAIVHMVRWCIEQYYGDADLPPTASD